MSVLRSRCLGLIVVGSVLLCQGCTLVGLTLGAATPKYERVDPPYASLDRDAEVRVQLASTTSVYPGTELRIEGRYARTEDSVVAVRTAEGERRLREQEIAALERRVGSEWKTGLLAGAAVDVVLVALVGFIALEVADRPSVSVGPWK